MNASERRILVRAIDLPETSLRAAIEGLIARTKKKARPSSRKAKKEKRLTRKERVDAVRPLVEARAGVLCECGCGAALLPFGEQTGEWDEFYGRQHISVEETWFLTRACHRAKSQNHPSREEWDRRFAAHCARYGYRFRPRFGGHHARQMKQAEVAGG